jgi:WD40 repeat protein
MTGALQQTLTGHTSWVGAVTFSLDGRRLASASGDKIVRIWDGETGALQQTLGVGGTIAELVFDRCTPDRLATDLGSIVLDSSYSPQAPSWSSYCIKANGSWITWNGSDVIFLPTEYRPTASIVRGRTVVIGCRSGRILLFKFSSDKTPCD